MKGYVENIEKLTEDNDDFRRVLYTGKNIQLVLMSLKPGEDIGSEVHADRDQFFRIEKGHGEMVIDGVKQDVRSDFAMIVPAGARHNLTNTGNKSMKFYTIYGPPNHIDQLVQTSKAEALASTEKYAGVSTE